MNSINVALPGFGENPQQDTPQPAPAAVSLGMAAATARLATYRDTQSETGAMRALLVVDCPFCDHQHIHPAGLASAPRVCPRTSRCIGRPSGTYHFPAVTR